MIKLLSYPKFSKLEFMPHNILYACLGYYSCSQTQKRSCFKEINTMSLGVQVIKSQSLKIFIYFWPNIMLNSTSSSMPGDTMFLSNSLIILVFSSSIIYPFSNNKFYYRYSTTYMSFYFIIACSPLVFSKSSSYKGTYGRNSQNKKYILDSIFFFHISQNYTILSLTFIVG